MLVLPSHALLLLCQLDNNLVIIIITKIIDYKIYKHISIIKILYIPINKETSKYIYIQLYIDFNYRYLLYINNVYILR